jgi:hypothetical protein
MQVHRRGGDDPTITRRTLPLRGHTIRDLLQMQIAQPALKIISFPHLSLFQVYLKSVEREGQSLCS